MLSRYGKVCPTIRSRLFLLLATFSVGIFTVTSAHAATYYVSVNGGSDSNPGTEAAPFKTIAKGSRAIASGDTLYIRAGIYNEVIAPSRNGMPGAYTRYAAAPGDEGKVVLKPSGDEFVVFFSRNTAYIEVSGMVLDGSNVASQTVKFDHSFSPPENAHHIRLIRNDIMNSPNAGILGGTDCEVIGNRIHGARAYGIYTGGGGSGGLIEGNIIYDNGGFGIHLFEQNHPVNGWVIRNNIFYGNGIGMLKRKPKTPENPEGTPKWETGYPAVILSRGGSQFYNNIVYNNHGGGVQVALGAVDTLVANNTVYGNGTYGIKLIAPQPGNAGSTNTRVINNISYGNAGSQIDDNGVNTTLQNNLTTDPKFVNPSTGDFGLQAGSAALDKGVAVAQVPTDFTSKARPEGAAYDIGAFEGAGSKANVLPGMAGGLPAGGGAGGGLGLGNCYK